MHTNNMSHSLTICPCRFIPRQSILMVFIYGSSHSNQFSMFIAKLATISFTRIHKKTEACFFRTIFLEMAFLKEDIIVQEAADFCKRTRDNLVKSSSLCLRTSLKSKVYNL